MANQIEGLLQMLRSGGAPKGVAALHSVDDIRRYAKKRLPKMIYDFVCGGANDETTLALLGRARLGEIDESAVNLPESWITLLKES